MTIAPDEPLPFDFNIETTTWTFPNGDKIELERNASGYFLSGTIDGKSWHDADHEDFYFPDADALLDFLGEHNLLGVLSTC